MLKSVETRGFYSHKIDYSRRPEPRAGSKLHFKGKNLGTSLTGRPIGFSSGAQ